MNHLRDRVPHMADGLCQYAHQYNNKVLICKVRLLFKSCLINPFFKKRIISVFKKAFNTLCLSSFSHYQRCYEGGREVIVVPKTSASSDNPWFGLAKYAWSGYVDVSTLVYERGFMPFSICVTLYAFFSALCWSVSTAV